MNDNIYKKRLKIGKTSTKKHKNNIIFLVSLSLLLIFVLLFLATLAYFSGNNSVTGNIRLAELDFTIFENDSRSNTVLPNGTYGKTVSVVNARNSDGSNFDNLCSIFLRFSFEVLVDDEIDQTLAHNLVLSTTNNFLNDQNFYYYLHGLPPGASVDLCNQIRFSSAIDNQYQNKSIKFVFNVDAVQSENCAYQEVWLDAPQEWIDAILTD